MDDSARLVYLDGEQQQKTQGAGRHSSAIKHILFKKEKERKKGMACLVDHDGEQHEAQRDGGDGQRGPPRQRDVRVHRVQQVLRFREKRAKGEVEDYLVY